MASNNLQEYPLHSTVLNKDIKKEILLRMPDADLFKACQIDNETAKLCDENFWWMKFVKEFGTDLEESRKNGININYRKIYKLLRIRNDEEIFSKSAQNGYIELVKQLIKLKRVDLNIFGDLALQYAAMHGHLNVVTHLIEQGVDINVNTDYSVRSASRNGHLNVVKYLIDNGADIHAYNDDALNLASLNGHLDVVKYLIENGADIHADGDIALQLASQYGYLNIVMYLVENGANVGSQNNLALQKALQGNRTAIVKYLIKHSAYYPLD